MIAFIKDHFWLVIMPLFGSVARLNAIAVAELMGAMLAPDARAPAIPIPMATSNIPTTQVRTVSADLLLKQNPFDHTTPTLTPSPDAAPPETPPDPLHAPTCQGIRALIITASDDSDWSFAALSSADGKIVLRRMRGDVDGKTLAFVGADRVWLESAGTLCQASLFEPAATNLQDAFSRPGHTLE